VTALTLPGMPKPPPPPLAAAGVSALRRLAQHQARDIQAGHHPLTGGPLHPQADRSGRPGDPQLRCGTCIHRVGMTGESGRTYPKCDVSKMSHGAATDVRAWWPACTRWEAT
jgi:hypothetical protein